MENKFRNSKPRSKFKKEWVGGDKKRNFKKFDGPKPQGLEVFVREGEDVMKAYRKLKKKIMNAGLMDELRERRYYQKPSHKKREAKRKQIARARSVMLENRILTEGLDPNTKEFRHKYPKFRLTKRLRGQMR